MFIRAVDTGRGPPWASNLPLCCTFAVMVTLVVAFGRNNDGSTLATVKGGWPSGLVTGLAAMTTGVRSSDDVEGVGVDRDDKGSKALASDSG